MGIPRAHILLNCHNFRKICFIFIGLYWLMWQKTEKVERDRDGFWLRPNLIPEYRCIWRGYYRFQLRVTIELLTYINPQQYHLWTKIMIRKTYTKIMDPSQWMKLLSEKLNMAFHSKDLYHIQDYHYGLWILKYFYQKVDPLLTLYIINY